MVGRRPRLRRANGTIERRIFVVGVPRSGTTLVQSLLAAHSQLTSFTESHFFSRYFKALPVWPWAILRSDPRPRLREFVRENPDPEDGSVTPVSELELPAGWLLPLKTREVAWRLLSAIDTLAMSRGTLNWIEKTPRHLRYLPFLERLDRRNRFVHVIREGLEVVASLHTASQSWERPYDLETCVARWNADVAFSLRRVGRSKDHFVVYEQLTSDPEATLQRLFAGLELDWQPEILDRYDSSRLVTREETWKAGVDRGVRRSGTSRKVLNEEQRDRVRKALRHDLYTRLVEQSAGRRHVS